MGEANALGLNFLHLKVGQYTAAAGASDVNHQKVVVEIAEETSIFLIEALYHLCAEDISCQQEEAVTLH